MANTKISALSAAATLDGTEQVPVVQSGATVRTTVSLLNAQSGTTVAGQIIGFKSYNPVADTTVTLSTSYGDIDATNLVVTFTGPASGLVLVEFNVVVFDSGGVYFNLRDGSGDIANTKATMLGNVSNIVARLTYSMSVAVTPTTSYTWKMGGKATGSTNHVRYGNGSEPYGPAIIKVMALP